MFDFSEISQQIEENRKNPDPCSDCGESRDENGDPLTLIQNLCYLCYVQISWSKVDGRYMAVIYAMHDTIDHWEQNRVAPGSEITIDKKDGTKSSHIVKSIYRRINLRYPHAKLYIDVMKGNIK